MDLPKTLVAAAVLALGTAGITLRRRGRLRRDAPRAVAQHLDTGLTGRPLPGSVAALTPHVDAQALQGTGPAHP